MSNFKLSWKTILISSLITGILLMLPVGFIIAEKNTKQIGFEDNSPFLVFQNSPTEKFINFNFMGKTYKLDFTPCYNVINDVSSCIYSFTK
ncbi:MAG: hypothetical protein RUMPE_00082 [Eubacteriales bacterium SKADARSKE-1]|nr:hypothetical protein [Eubacteriales bacterium SKADARSKE-1]